MDSQLYIIIPFEIVLTILNWCELREVCTFRVTCKKFQKHIDTVIHPHIATTITKSAVPLFGVLDSSSNILYTSTRFNHVINKVDLLTNQESILCGTLRRSLFITETSEKQQFQFPSGLALNEKERILYISDTFNCVIKCVNLIDGKIDIIAGREMVCGSEDGIGREATFNHPCGLALDLISNHLYVVDRDNDSIRRILLEDNRVETLCGPGLLKEPKLDLPYDIVLNSNTQELYISDWGNHVIRLLSLKDRTVSVFCGTLGVKGCKNGPLREAQFNYPSGLALDSHSQCLYVADENHVVRRISLFGEKKVDILCGIPGKGGDKGGPFPQFGFPSGVIIDPHSHSLYIMDSSGVRKVIFRSGLY